jgi:geranylgeranyl pyrophosphate synthase
VTQSTTDRWLEAISARVDRAVRQIADDLPSAEATPLSGAVRYALETRGKRLRPALCVATYEAVAGQSAPDHVIDLSTAVELIHTYSLVHDDLPCMDNDHMRRGRPTTHREAGNGNAMLAGAVLIPLAFRVLLRSCRALQLPDDATQAAALELARGAGAAGMVGGQVLDLDSEGRAISLEDLEFLHRAKTGALIGAATRLGAIAAQGSIEALRAMRTYARCVGLAFQITDDVLDETLPSERLGKTSGKDRRVRKATYPAFMGVESARRRAEQEIAEALAALESASLRTATLEALARFAIERDR